MVAKRRHDVDTERELVVDPRHIMVILKSTFYGKEVWVPYANMARRECTVRRPGDCGLLIVPHWLAVNLELLDRAA